MINLLNGDCLDVLKTLPENSIDSIVTDPPYGLAFMGKKWDYDVPSVEIWKEVLRVLKPGGHLLSFGGTRTYRRMVINIEDAGFEIRDQIMWIYGSGFPKSRAIDRDIDKSLGAVRAKKEMSACKAGAMDDYKVRNGGQKNHHMGEKYRNRKPGETVLMNGDIPVTDSAKQWQGWGTALKPANEPICLARKPISEKTVAANVLKHGTGAMNIDESRIEFQSEADKLSAKPQGNMLGVKIYNSGNSLSHAKTENTGFEQSPQGRWPANVIFDEEAGKILDEQSGVLKSGDIKKDSYKNMDGRRTEFHTLGKQYAREVSPFKGDSGGASRFFYCAKTSKSERNAGLEGMPEKRTGDFRKGGAGNERSEENYSKMQNFHPTVKPIKLMTYLIKLITPPNGIALDPFMGSGSTGVACRELFIGFVGIERDIDYFNIASVRINRD